MTARTVGRLLLLGGTVAVGSSLPSVLVLPTFLPHPPRSLPSGRCHWSGDPGAGTIAVTFDDGPSTETAETLDLLDELDMKATFFVLGRQLAAHPDLAREMVRRGHEVATHGFDHRHHLLSRPRTIRRDLDAAVQAHRDILGVKPRYLRPPYGQCSTATMVEARRHGLEVVLWSRWGKEFAEREPGPVMDRLQPGVKPGAIILLHDVDVSCRPGTAALTRQTLPTLGALLEARSLTGVTLSRLVGG
jgi:peptidoglycan/xylan/chitin deacetylase (PgdA/CDA1 family)